MFLALALTGLGFWGIAKATAVPETAEQADENGTSSATVVAEPAGISTMAMDTAVQDGKEVGFIGNSMNKKGNSVFAWTQGVLDPGQVSITQFDKFKASIAADHTAFQQQNLRGTFDHDYHRPIPPRNNMKMPLIGIPHAGAEIKSGQNLEGNVKILSSNPYAYHENAGPQSQFKEQSGYMLAKTYGQNNQVNYDRWGEARMSWTALGNPWRPSGEQYNLHTSWLPPDKDQLTGHAPIQYPRHIFQANGYPTQVVAPPTQQVLPVNVFNRQVKVAGKSGSIGFRGM